MKTGSLRQLYRYAEKHTYKYTHPLTYEKADGHKLQWGYSNCLLLDNILLISNFNKTVTMQYGPHKVTSVIPFDILLCVLRMLTK